MSHSFHLARLLNFDLSPFQFKSQSRCRIGFAASCGVLAVALWGSWNPAAAQTSASTTTTLVVTSASGPVTTVTSGTVVTLTATVTAGSTAVTTGQVNFCDATAKYCTDIHLLGTAQLIQTGPSAGTATMKFRPGIGSHSYKAVFLGTNSYAGSASSASALAVTGTPGPIATATTVAKSGFWGNYTLMATVTEAGQTTVPTGAVSFLDASNGNSALAIGTLGAAVAGIGWPNPRAINISYDTSFVLVADLNGDGIPDLVVNGNPVVIYLGKADGTYTETPIPSISGPVANPMVIADFNGDGIPDLAIAMYSSSTVSILLGKGDGTFAAPVEANLPSAATNVSQLVTADFNGDGIPDLAVVDNYDSVLAILLGKGDGTFTETSTPPFSGRPSGIATGDFNGDGKTDLAVAASYGDSITILLGNGDGTFTIGSTFHSGTVGSETGALQIATADFNGDGKLDLAVPTGGTGGASESVTILTGNGDGTFNPSSSGQTSNSTIVTWIQIADFNQDGAPDVVLADSNGSATVLLNNGSGAFGNSLPVLSGLSTPYYLMVGVGDLNGDGYPDIVAGGYYNNTLGLYLTEPTETAAATANITLADVGQHLVDASYGGDGNYNSSVSGTTPLWGVPPGTTTTLTLSSGGAQVASVPPGSVVTLTTTVKVGANPLTTGQVNFCDASATDCTDIHLLGTVAVNSSGTATFKFVPGPGAHAYKAMFVQDGYGSTSSSAVLTLTVGPAPSPVYSDTTAITDSGSPGDYLLTATVVGYGGSAPPTGSVSFLDTSFGNTALATAPLGPSTAGMGWLIPQTPAAGGNPISEITADFNGDGIPDLAILWDNNIYSGPPSVTILFGQGDGSFTTGPTVQVTGAQGYPTMIAGDFNGDGKMDLAVLSWNGYSASYITTLLGNGDGTFGTPQTGTVYNQGAVGGDGVSGSMVAADFNGDGKLDIAVVGDYVSPGGITILLGNGDGTFKAPGPNILPNHGFGLVATGDFNGDGIPDLVTADYYEDYNGKGSATVLLGNGDGTFTAVSSFEMWDFPKAIVVGDFNGDGVPDLAFGFDSGGGTQAVSVFLGKGDGTFSAGPAVTGTASGISLVAGDFSHDGILDLAGIDSYHDQIDLFIGAGDGTFTVTATTPVVSQSFLGPFALVATDFNEDGVPDLAMLTKNVDTASILLTEPTQTATATVNGLAPVGAGTHNVEASYPGDSSYPSSVSGTVALTAGLAPLAISPAAGTYSTVQTITISESVPGATIYYSGSGIVNTNGFVPYTGPIQLTEGGVETIQAYATETGYQQSAYATVTYTLNLPPAAMPVISLASGSYPNAQKVTITAATPGAVIYFATNGAFLNGGMQYTGPIAVSTSETLVAYAIAPGYSDSVVASAEYIIDSSPSSFIYTVADNGIYGYTGDGGPATIADLNGPRSVAAVPAGLPNAGDLYIADIGNNVVRRVAAGTGIITTVAGTGIGGYTGDNGPAISAQLLYPSAVAVDNAGNLWILDSGNNTIRIVAAATGTITSTNLNGLIPQGFALDGSNNLYVSVGNRIWRVAGTSNIPIAGNGNYSYTGDNGPATSATLGSPEGLAFDSAGNLYIADTYNSVIRKVTNGIITTVAGNSSREGQNGFGYPSAGYSGDGGPATSAQLNFPYAVTFDGAGNLHIADTYNSAIRKVTSSTGIITTVAGNGGSCVAQSGDGGPATSSALCLPTSISFDSAGDLYISEGGFNRVREVTVSGPPPTAVTAAPVLSVAVGTYVNPQTVTITDATPGAAIYVAMNPPATSPPNNPSVPTELLEPGYYGGPINVTGTATIQVVAVAPGYLPSAPVTAAYTITTPPTAVITTVAGNGTNGFSGMGGPATAAEIGITQGLSFDKSGNLYFTDTSNSVVWMVAQGTGTITVVAGNGSPGYMGDNGPAVNAELYYPSAVALDKTGNLYIADSINNVVREVAAGTGVITTIAGVYRNFGYPGHNGDGGPATSAYLNEPASLVFDETGNLYIGDSGEGSVRVISASTGIITTFAGGRSGIETEANNGDGGPAADALLNATRALTFDSAGNLYIADSGRVRMMAASTGIINTVAGNGDAGSSGDGGLAVNAEVYPQGLAVDAAGNLYISNTSVTVREVTASTGVITTVAGSGFYGHNGDGGSATVAEISYPEGIAFDAAGSLYIADTYNYRVRKVFFSGQAATPEPFFSVAAGTYTSAQTVSISDTILGATIYYTTDGTTPTTASTVYGGPITVSTTETLQATAIATGYAESSVATAAYTINQPAIPTISWAPPAAITYGTALSATQLDANSNVSGTFAYSPAAGTVLNAGVQKLSVTFTPTDSTDYAKATATVSLSVNQGVPTITWPAPAAINFGTALSATQLDATASVPGTFAYTPAAGTIPPVGSDTLSVTFTATDATDYTTATAKVTIIVNQPVPAIGSLSPAIEPAGTAAFTLTINGSGFTASSTVNWGSTALSTQYVSGTELTAQVPASAIASAGTATVTVQNPAPGGASNALRFEVDSAGSNTPPNFTTITATVSPGSSATYPVTLPSSATNVSAACLNLPSGATCSYSAATGAVAIITSSATQAGTYQIIVVFTETIPGSATAMVFLPILLLPLMFLRRRWAARGFWFAACLLLLVSAAAVATGCGGGGGSTSSPPPQTHQVTSSGAVTLTVQ